MPRPPKKFVPTPFEYHQEIELRIDSLTNLGAGVGRIDGWVVFVPFALPGELVRIKAATRAVLRRSEAFNLTFQIRRQDGELRFMRNRITAFINLPISSIDRMALGPKLRDIGSMEGSSSKASGAA